MSPVCARRDARPPHDSGGGRPEVTFEEEAETDDESRADRAYPGVTSHAGGRPPADGSAHPATAEAWLWADGVRIHDAHGLILRATPGAGTRDSTGERP
jgi:hypothetical protein